MIRPRVGGRAAFSGVIALVAAWALVQTLHWPIKTALYPRAVGIPLLVLAVAETLLTLLRRNTADVREAADVALSADVPADVAARRTAVMAAWMVGFFLGIVLVGFPRAVPIFVLAYLRWQGREPWTISIALAGAAWLGFYLVFIRLLHLPFDHGLLWRLL